VGSILTVSEVASLLRALEGRFALTPRGIRYYARTGMVVPSRFMRRTNRARTTRLYDVIDVALLRLVCRLHRQRVHERAIWGLLVYRGDEVRLMLEAGTGEIIVTDRAALGIGSEDSTGPKPIRTDIRWLMNGLAERLAAYRRREPEIWTGLAWISADDVVKEMITRCHPRQKRDEQA
jgi:hypothetical protein